MFSSLNFLKNILIYIYKIFEKLNVPLSYAKLGELYIKIFNSTISLLLIRFNINRHGVKLAEG